MFLAPDKFVIDKIPDEAWAKLKTKAFIGLYPTFIQHDNHTKENLIKHV